MQTKIISITEGKGGNAQMRIAPPQGPELIIGFMSQTPLLCSDEYSEAVAIITDNFAKQGGDDYFNYLTQQLVSHGFEMPLYVMPDRDAERERLGRRIKELRESQHLDAKVLAAKAEITPANLCRIEQGKYSPGLDIICRIASALNMHLDFVPDTKGGAE